MKRLLLRFGLAGALITLLLFPLVASAHETVTVGNYEVEYGWLNEPPIVGQPNAVVLNISEAQAGGETPLSGTITLAAPSDGAMVHGDHVQVEVEFGNLDENADAHWHLYLDDELLAMVPLHQTSVTVTGLSNGSHTFKAALATAEHDELSESATAKVTVEGAADAGDPAVEDVEPIDGHTHGAFADVDVSGLKVEVVYGPDSKVLSLQPLGEDTPGQFIAPLTPTRAGQYALRLTGKIGESDVNVEVQPEEVEGADAVQFPPVAAAPDLTPQLEAANARAGTAQTIAIVGAVLGLAGLALGGVSLMRKK